MKKQFLRVKQIADQTFLRAEKTEVLTDDLVTAEKRVDTIRISCQTTQKKISSCNIDFGSENSAEKRLKKVPQIALGTSMLENGNNFAKNSVLGDILRECSTVQTKLGSELLEYYNEVEKTVLKPISSVLDNDIHNINKLRKQLGKLVLDMDSARTRFQTAEKHSTQTSASASLNTLGKVENLKEELEDASQKVDQCRDVLATEMFSLISREPHLAHLFIHLHKLQADYHRNALAILESTLPILKQDILDFPQKPVFGCSLQEHLRVTNRDIAYVIETCILFLLEYTLEEGLLRIAGSASKLKKLKSAFDAGIDIDMTEFVRDPHAVSGALKSYLRELPEPLLTFSLYEEWINAAKIQDFDTKLQALWQVLHKLPDANFKNLQYVVKFLSKLYENVDTNKMSSQNIAIVMAPNLIWPASEDSSASFGMNMSTASLHTSVVDILISYADWFFPDFELSPTSKISNLNDTNPSEVTSDSLNSDNEINGNNLQVSSGSAKDSTASSPRIHRNIKKPAAPPPPAQRSLDCDKSTNNEVIPPGELIDFSIDNLDSFAKTCDNTFSKSDTLNSQSNKDEKKLLCSLIRRKSNENFNNSDILNKTEKPTIPDKPATYSSCSLDRRSHRQSSSSRDRISESIVRSHIERPTVPPPERPSKPPKFCSSENISHNPKRSSGDEESVETNTKMSPVSPCKAEFEAKQDENTIVPTVIFKSDRNTSTLQHSRSSTKVNRFDFLVNQNNDKPPERPPRSTVDHTERSTIPETVEVEVSHNVPSSGSINVVVNMSSSDSATSQPPVGPRATELEKMKPPRPQPPVPAKPKFNMANENTSL